MGGAMKPNPQLTYFSSTRSSRYLSHPKEFTMSKKTIPTLASLLVSASFSFAQTAPASAPANSHKTYDQKARDCRKAGADKQLTGEELRAFVAACIAPPKPAAN
jgi:hypothetical protein